MVEDDSQDGADHVDGHRAPVQIISPWAAHGVVDSTYYSQITMVRTIEQILGAQPLNQKVAAATPMYGAFTDDAGQHAVHRGAEPGPADRGHRHPAGLRRWTRPAEHARRAPTGTAAGGRRCPRTQRPPPRPGRAGPASSTPPATARSADFANPEQMNRYTWYETHDWKVPYPGDPKIYLPNEVPGAALPGSEAE